VNRRVTIGRMMLAVAVVGVVLGLERFLYNLAYELVRTHTEPVIRSEAVMGWACLNVPIVVLAGLVLSVVRQYARDREGARHAGPTNVR
jgi:H+/Cl- antiporter ClcA